MNAARTNIPAAIAMEKLTLTLTGDEAIVLFGWLSQFNAAEGRQFEDQAEQRVLWDLQASLESVREALFEP